jgi:hypothetical protein
VRCVVAVSEGFTKAMPPSPAPIRLGRHQLLLRGAKPNWYWATGGAFVARSHGGSMEIVRSSAKPEVTLEWLSVEITAAASC